MNDKTQEPPKTEPRPDDQNTDELLAPEAGEELTRQLAEWNAKKAEAKP